MIDKVPVLVYLNYIITLVSQRSNDFSLGYIVIGVIVSPIIILISAAFLGRPRNMKVTALFMGWLILMFAAFVGSVYILGFIFSLFY